MIVRRAVRTLRADDGSILPLALGYVVLAATLIAVTVDLTSLYLTQKQADALADAAALAGADGFTLTVDAGQASTTLDDAEVREQAAAIVAASPHDAMLTSATSPDGTSARVSVTIVWHPPVASLFVPNGVILGATATSRTALN